MLTVVLLLCIVLVSSTKPAPSTVLHSLRVNSSSVSFVHGNQHHHFQGGYTTLGRALGDREVFFARGEGEAFVTVTSNAKMLFQVKYHSTLHIHPKKYTYKATKHLIHYYGILVQPFNPSHTSSSHSLTLPLRLTPQCTKPIL